MALDGGCASNCLQPYELRALATATPTVHSHPIAMLCSQLVLKTQGMLQCDNRAVAGHIEYFKAIFHACAQRPVQGLLEQVAGCCASWHGTRHRIVLHLFQYIVSY